MIKKCNYPNCDEEVFKDTDNCILHIELPENQKSDEFKRISNLKDKKIKEKIDRQDFNFDGVKLFRFTLKHIESFEINLSNIKVDNNVYLEDIKVYDKVLFDNAQIDRFIFLKNLTINGDLFLKNVKCLSIEITNCTIHQDVDCDEIESDFLRFKGGGQIGGSILLFGMKNVKGIQFNGRNETQNKLQIGSEVFFGREIQGDLSLDFVEIEGTLYLDNLKVRNLLANRTKINGNVWFYGSEFNQINFDEVEINGDTNFDGTKISGKFNCKNINLTRLTAAEETYRVAKNVWAVLGDREESDYYFYHEMVAKRQDKSWYLKYPELFAQYCFGYGVYPIRIMITWIVFIITFALIYSTQKDINMNFISYFYSSVVTGITPGFGNYRPEGIYQLVASIEAIIGTFLWAAFIATFTRKYMR